MILQNNGAVGGTRTHTSLRSYAPETYASTSSATTAKDFGIITTLYSIIPAAMKKLFIIFSVVYGLGLLFFLSFSGHFLRDLLINFLPYIVLLHIPLLFILFAITHHTEPAFQRKAKLIMVGIAISMVVQSVNIFTPSFSLETTRPTSEVQPPLKVLFSNVMKLNNDPTRLLDLIKKENPDIIGIAELTPIFANALIKIKEQYSFQSVFPASHGFGIGLFSKIELFEPSIQKLSTDIPFIKSQVQWHDRSIYIFVVHLLPPVIQEWFDRRNTSLEELATFITNDQSAIVMGDFNLTPWSRFYQRFTQKTGLKNARNFRNGFHMSWYGWGFYLPIDHIFYSSDIAINRFEIGPNVGSDHYPLISEFTH